MATKKAQTISNIDLLLAASVVLAGYFLFSLLQLLQNVKVNGMLGSPSSYAGVPSGLLAAYVLSKANSLNRKYIAVIVLTVIIMGVVVWLYGATSAGASLAS